MCIGLQPKSESLASPHVFQLLTDMLSDTQSDGKLQLIPQSLTAQYWQIGSQSPVPPGTQPRKCGHLPLAFFLAGNTSHTCCSATKVRYKGVVDHWFPTSLKHPLQEAPMGAIDTCSYIEQQSNVQKCELYGPSLGCSSSSSSSSNLIRLSASRVWIFWCLTRTAR